MTELGWPAFDAESVAPWRAITGNDLDGQPTGITAEMLPRIRAFTMSDREALLAGRQFGGDDVEIATPDGKMTLSVFLPRERREGAPAIFWIHGGGMIVGDRFGAGDALDLAEASGAVVVSPEYRLAPEHPSPAALDDCLAGFRWFSDHVEELGADPRRLFLAGGSAGGGLAAACALRIRDEGGPALSGLILLSPMLDDRMAGVSAQQFTFGVPWTRSSNVFGWRCLLGERAGTQDVSIYEAPGRAGDLTGLPPSFIDVGSADLFRDESVAFASAIWGSGGNAELHVWPGGYHGFEQMAPASALAVAAVAARKSWLSRILAAQKEQGAD
ncbi:alpha/beta hydrolase [Actinocorallia longicatena]|uniref:Alpha/beta hydrolase n=1 Tax=Actinocorallia longicatena TaxID=111803 RepID=A0ABP6QCL2_9ACTN